MPRHEKNGVDTEQLLKQRKTGFREFKPIADWRKKKPGQGEAHVMTKDGQEYKWCDKCLKGQGLWTVGKNRHVTSDHKT